MLAPLSPEASINFGVILSLLVEDFLLDAIEELPPNIVARIALLP